jgi:hypothetical protein
MLGVLRKANFFSFTLYCKKIEFVYRYSYTD